MKKLMTLFLFLILSNLNAAEILRYNGDVYINSVKLESKIDVRTGDLIEAKGKGSFFIVRYKDGSRFLIKEGKIKIDELSPKKKQSSFNLIKGLMVSFVNPKTKNKFKVKSKNTVFGVRGTKFWLSNNKDYSYLCVCSGSVAAEKDGVTALISKGEDLTVRSSEKKLSVKKANPQMWQMAREEFQKLDIEVDAL